MKMKQLYKVLCVICIMGLLTSCGDFLERSSQNLIIPNKVSHFKELLQGEAYFKDLFNCTAWIQFMTDDAEFQEGYSRSSINQYSATNINYYGAAYTWQQEIENANFTDVAYLYLYKQIKVANICIDGLKNVEGGDEEREIILGQAYFTRAMGYFYLANLYAQAYNEANPGDLCVPLILDENISTNEAPRATIEQVWGQMKSDIKMAIDYLKDKKTGNIYTIGYKAALLLGSRIHLFTGDWETTIHYGESLLELQPQLMDISKETKATKAYYFSGSSAVINFYNPNNLEIIWNFNETPIYSLYTYYGLLSATGIDNLGYWLAVSSQTNYSGQKSLISMYDADLKTKTGDRRLLYWFIPPSNRTSAAYVTNFNTYKSLKYDIEDGNKQMLLQCFRTGEIYVSLAEAYARRNAAGDAEKSISYLNRLRRNRINPYTELVMANFKTNEELIQFCWDERRRELCFEECHRWWDMRREGQKSVIHNYNEGGTIGNKFDLYTLKEKDPSFTLNFPLAERSLSPSMPTNARPQRNANN